MANRIRTGEPRGFNKGCSSKFRVGSQIRQTPEEGRWTYRPKHCGNNNKDEDNSPETLNDKNHQVSSKKFRQLKTLFMTQVFTVLLRITSGPLLIMAPFQGGNTRQYYRTQNIYTNFYTSPRQFLPRKQHR